MPLIALLAIPFVAALVVWPVRQVRQIAAPISALACLLVAGLAPLAAGQEALSLMGRSLALSAQSAFYVSVLSVALGLLMGGGWLAPESPLVWSSALATFGLLLTAACATSMQLAGAFMALAVLGIACCLLDPSSPELIMRTIIVLLAGTLLLFVAGWVSEAARGESPLSLTFLGQPAALFGLALVLGVLPFGLWAPPLSRASRPTGAFLAVCALGLLASLRLDELSALSDLATWSLFLRWGGVVTLLYGAIGAMLPRELSAVTGYAALADVGIAALAMSVESAGALSLATQHLAYRALACATLWVAARVLSNCFGTDDLRPLAGAFRRAPLTLTAVWITGLSLAGLPPTAGYASRAAILGMVDLRSPWIWACALSALGPAWGITRIVVSSWGSTPPPGSRREPLWLSLLLLAVALGLLALGLVPELGPWFQGLFSG